MLEPVYRGKFEKDLLKAIKRQKDLSKLKKIILLLCEEQALPLRNRNHKLSGEYNGYRECHIEPDWLLIYTKTKKELWLIRLGSHADLFR
ncbi:MAG: Addiction module toxin, RelE/StbE family [candidate division TM6 bacterium GW2011_GWF2_30_66]|jgi:mRNA interferase YafQ|nr:MAG: Addiction module toxin, RelE/StbE family [candidate division TM6 bacterium GW2011_GWF2_30_66]